MSTGKTCQYCICFLLVVVIVINYALVFQHEIATISLSKKEDDFTLTIAWKKNDDRVASGNANKALFRNSNLRSANIDPNISVTDDSEKKQETAESPSFLIKYSNGGGEQKKKMIKRINPTGDGIRKKLQPSTDKDNKNKNDSKKVDAKKKNEESINTKEKVIIMKDPVDGALQTKQASNATKFARQDHVVIATKIHGKHQWGLLVQSMCLFHYAYNQQVRYDIVVFATEPVPEEDIKVVQDMLSPVKLSLVVDNKGLQNEIAALSPESREIFLGSQSCNVTDASDLNWFSNCRGHRLAYNWQAEFRGKHLWHHPSLREYKTMLWIDADGFATKPWPKDPVEYFVQNDGVIMFDHFPQAKSNFKMQEKLVSGFNKTICSLKLSEETGNLVSELGTPEQCLERGIPNIHGFMHITNLDFFRSPVVTKALDAVFHNCFLNREPDDQLIVTAIPAILAPDRAWDMRSKGFRLDVFHNYKLDGLEQAKPAGFLGYWKEVAKHTLPAADGVCEITEAN